VELETPIRKYFCPRCKAAYPVDQNFCGACGADMHRASKLFAQNATPDEIVTVRGKVVDDRIDMPAPSDPWIGRVVDDRYRVLEIIGRGGMGVVYKVAHQRMGKIAAMKVLGAELARDPEGHVRFQREAEAVSRLTHPHTVQVFDFGMVEGSMYLVMEYVRGLDLAFILHRDGALPLSRAMPLFTQILSAVAEAHEKGVIHRDLKPENILVTRTHTGEDFVKVLDFGLAKLTGRQEFNEVTDRNRIVGTPYYMSPEQIRGEDVDRRSDIYSFGALMYRMLTGQYAFEAPTPVAVLTKHLTDVAVPPSERNPAAELNQDIDDVIMRCLAKNRHDRYSSAEEVLGVLAEVSVTKSRPRPVEVSFEEAEEDSDRRLKRADVDRFERMLRRRRAYRILILPLVLLAIAGGGLVWTLSQPKKPQSREREPNDTLESATPISTGRAVRGYMGKRQSITTPDADVYQIANQASGFLTATLSPIPNVDLQLRVYDGTGKLLTHVDDAKIGGGEALTRFRVEQPVYIMVTQPDPVNTLPTENVSDPYRLEVALDPL
jgi:serine/threonine-protein kinase